MTDLANKLKTLNALIAQRAEIDRKQETTARVLTELRDDQDQLATLLSTRKKALGKAVIEGKKADTAAIDAEIATVQKRVNVAGDKKLANEAATDQLTEQAELLDEAIRQARDAARECAGEIVAGRLDTEIQLFRKSMNELRTVALRVAAANIIATRFSRQRLEDTQEVVASAAMVDRDSSFHWEQGLDASAAPFVTQIEKTLADAGWQA